MLKKKALERKMILETREALIMGWVQVQQDSIDGDALGGS